MCLRWVEMSNEKKDSWLFSGNKGEKCAPINGVSQCMIAIVTWQWKITEHVVGHGANDVEIERLNLSLTMRMKVPSRQVLPERRGEGARSKFCWLTLADEMMPLKKSSRKPRATQTSDHVTFGLPPLL